MNLPRLACTCFIGLSLAASATMFSLRTIKLPLWYHGEDETGIQILSVPKVDFDTPGNWNMIQLFDDPFEQYDPRQPATGSTRKSEDLNMIYAYGITTSAVFGVESDPDQPVKLVINITDAEKAHSFTVLEVAQAAAVCIRDLFPKNSGVPLVLKNKDGETAFEPPFATGQ